MGWNYMNPNRMPRPMTAEELREILSDTSVVLPDDNGNYTVSGNMNVNGELTEKGYNVITENDMSSYVMSAEELARILV